MNPTTPLLRPRQLGVGSSARKLLAIDPHVLLAVRGRSVVRKEKPRVPESSPGCENPSPTPIQRSQTVLGPLQLARSTWGTAPSLSATPCRGVRIRRIIGAWRVGLVGSPTFFIFFLFSFFALTVIPGPALFSLTIRLRNPFLCLVTFVTGQRLLKHSFPDSASRLCTVGSATYLLLSLSRSATRHYTILSNTVLKESNYVL